MKLEGKTAIITGGSRGIGHTVAKLFSDEGANLMITAKNLKRLEHTANEIGNVLFEAADIKDEKQVQYVVKKTVDSFGKIDILVNNAGIFPTIKPLHQISEQEWNEVIDVNLNGPFRFTKAVIPFMEKNGGSIINVSSDAGLKAFENFEADAYTASKGALVSLTKALAVEYAKSKIRVNCVCPGVVETDMASSSLTTESDRKMVESEHPLGRLGTTDEVAKAILYFASDDSSWTTGAILAVDGGVSAK